MRCWNFCARDTAETSLTEYAVSLSNEVLDCRKEILKTSKFTFSFRTWKCKGPVNQWWLLAENLFTANYLGAVAYFFHFSFFILSLSYINTVIVPCKRL